MKKIKKLEFAYIVQLHFWQVLPVKVEEEHLHVFLSEWIILILASV
jgi:hypothetical protein